MNHVPVSIGNRKTPVTLRSPLALLLLYAAALPGMPLHAETLRDLAGRRSVGIGAAVDAKALRDNAEYRAVLCREFTMVVAENAMKMWIQQERGKFSFSDADEIVAFAQSNKMRVRGHTLVWHQSLPRWFMTGSWSRAETLSVLSQHIASVVGHYKGAVYAWDVVNEAVEDDGSMRKTVWLDRIGPDYLDHAFRLAHAADPKALLFYNDYGAEWPCRKADAILAMVARMQSNGVPIDGVGFQCHFDCSNYPAPAMFAANMNRFSALGLEVQVTELDVGVKKPVTDDKRAIQARVYRDIIDAACRATNCTAILTWGFTDKYSWKADAEALPFDRAFRPKPAYEAIRNGLKVNALHHATTRSHP